MTTTAKTKRRGHPGGHGVVRRETVVSDASAVIEAPAPIEVVALNRVETVVSSIDCGNDNVTIAVGSREKDIWSIPSVTCEILPEDDFQPLSFPDGTGATIRVEGQMIVTGRAAMESRQEAIRTATNSFRLKPQNALFFHLSWVTAYKSEANEINSYLVTQAQADNLKVAMQEALHGSHDVEVLTTSGGETVSRKVRVNVHVLRVMHEGPSALIAAKKVDPKLVEGKVLAIDIGSLTMIGFAMDGDAVLLPPTIGETKGVIALVEQIRRHQDFLSRLEQAYPAQYQLVVQGLRDRTFNYWTTTGPVSFKAEFEKLLKPFLGDPLVGFIDYCLGLVPDTRFDRILLLSGGSQQVGLKEFVASRYSHLKIGVSPLGSNGNAIGMYLLAVALHKKLVEG